MTAPPDAVFIGLRGVNHFHADIGDKAFIPLDGPTMQAAIAAAEARGLRMAAERVYTKLQDRARKNATLTNDAQAARDAILALIPAPPADGGDLHSLVAGIRFENSAEVDHAIELITGKKADGGANDGQD